MSEDVECCGSLLVDVICANGVKALLKVSEVSKEWNNEANKDAVWHKCCFVVNYGMLFGCCVSCFMLYGLLIFMLLLYCCSASSFPAVVLVLLLHW